MKWTREVHGDFPAKCRRMEGQICRTPIRFGIFIERGGIFNGTSTKFRFNQSEKCDAVSLTRTGSCVSGMRARGLTAHDAALCRMPCPRSVKPCCEFRRSRMRRSHAVRSAVDLNMTRAACDKSGVLPTVDAIMSGMGRTGCLFACDDDAERVRYACRPTN
ncbi:aminotransferase class III-fold pyridoxal phosphate-dependent enzyme [Burkholderia seminalis]|nr:aminotransferase class III-fold pyridoxal phosphate-dependent enzyme [Burkholderia seminalis]